MKNERPIGSDHASSEPAADSKRVFVEPKLTFVKPTLTKHGGVTEVTAQFFGPITP